MKDLVNSINESTGLKLNVVKSLQTRKGFAYKVEEYGTEILLKGIELKTGRTRSLQQEAHILKNLNDYTDNLYVNSGEVDWHFGLLRKWLEGKTALKHTSILEKIRKYQRINKGL